MMPFGSECCKGSKLHVDLFLEWYTRRTTRNGILKNCTVANIAIKAFLRVSARGCTMVPFGSECCKGSKLHVDLFLDSYTRRTTHNGILKNCTVANIAIKAFLRV